MTALSDLIAAADQLWPTALAEPWDRPGLAVGDPNSRVTHVHLALDVTDATLAEAANVGADVLFTHHPTLFRPAAKVTTVSWPGRLVYRAAQRGIALFSAHTNADSAAGGVNDVLAGLIGIAETAPLVPNDDDPRVGLGRVGRLSAPTALGQLAADIARALPSTASQVRVAGDFDELVRTVAVCSGAGDSLLDEPTVRAADVYVSADLRHHVSIDARARGQRGLINLSHWASEWVWLPVAADQLRQAVPGIEVTVSDLRTDPWDFTIAQ